MYGDASEQIAARIADMRERREYLDLDLLQMSPQEGEMDRLSAQVMR